MPGAAEHGVNCVYDAWNRLVRSATQRGTILAEYQYDGTGRRIVEFTNFTVIGTSYPATVTYFYFSGQNAIETRSATFTPGNRSQPRVVGAQYQYVFSPLGVKTPLLRDTYVDGSDFFRRPPLLPDRRQHERDGGRGIQSGARAASGRCRSVTSYDPYGAVTMYDGPASRRH